MSGPLAFLCVMLGLGLRLDSAWQGLGGTLVVAGVALAVVAWRNAFFRDDRVR